MITSISIENFKNLRKLSVDLEPLTVFVGANASGKSSVLQALQLAVRATRAIPDEVFAKARHCDWLYTRGGLGDLLITAGTSGGTFSVRASPPVDFPPTPSLLGKSLWRFGVEPPEFHVGTTRLEADRPLVFLHLNVAQLARPSYSERDPPRVEHDGGGLASALAYMALKDPETFDELTSHMQELVPRLKRIRFNKAPINRGVKEYLRVGDEPFERRTVQTFQGESIVFDFENADNVAAHTASEGTLIVLGLLTVLFDPARPRILLLDNIEQGLHPLAQKKLVDVLVEVLRRFPDLQILATAHSPYLLDCLLPEQIRLMSIGENGHAVSGRLTDHPQFSKWKDEMAPGELWSLFGENWIAKEAPSP